MDMLGNVISIHALREEGDCCVVLHSQHGAISIHALREEGDEPSPASPATWTYFYPRPPRGGRLSHACTDAQKAQFLSTPSARRATSKSRPSIKPETFLSTPSARRATRYPGGDGSRLGDFYPRPPRGGRPRLRTRASLSWYFYPRPPRGGRRASLSVVDESFTFLSTPSARRATWGRYRLGLPVTDFYPRPPRGGRLSPCATVISESLFLSTPSARRATLPPLQVR